ncbi:unnamed protein product [Caenorhabditis nigoni]
MDTVKKHILEKAEKLIVLKLITHLASGDGCNAGKKDDEIKELRKEILSKCLDFAAEELLVQRSVSDNYKEELKTRIRVVGQQLFDKKFNEYYHYFANFKFETTEAYDSFVKKTKNEAGRAMLDKSNEGKNLFEANKWQEFLNSRKPHLDERLEEIKFAFVGKMSEVPKEFMDMILVKMFEVFELKYTTDVLKACLKLQNMQTNLFKKLVEQKTEENKKLEHELSVKKQENMVYKCFADGHTYVIPPPPKAGELVVPTGRMVRCICKPDCQMTSFEPEYVLLDEVMKRQ